MPGFVVHIELSNDILVPTGWGLVDIDAFDLTVGMGYGGKSAIPMICYFLFLSFLQRSAYFGGGFPFSRLGCRYWCSLCVVDVHCRNPCHDCTFLSRITRFKSGIWMGLDVCTLPPPLSLFPTRVLFFIV